MANNFNDLVKQFPQLSDIPSDKFPHHVFIIPDGNGRWAKKRNMFVTQGHMKGFEAAEKILQDLSFIPEIKIVTLWGFACDNWKRSELEVKGLMHIFEKAVKKIIKTFTQENRKFIHLGRKDRLPLGLIALLNKAEEETRTHTGQVLCFAIDFGGEDQTLRMLEQAQQMDKNEKITLEILRSLRDGKGCIIPADLLIRTSGEKRTSDVGWLNGSSTELYFTDTLFPDLTTTEIIAALDDFSKRERRFGGRVR